MFRPNRLKARVLAGEKSFGTWLQSAAPTFAEMAAIAGFDFFIVDQEHGPGDLRDAIDMMRAASGGRGDDGRPRAVVGPGLSQAAGRCRRRGGAGADGRDGGGGAGDRRRLPVPAARHPRQRLGHHPLVELRLPGRLLRPRRRQPPDHRPDRDREGGRECARRSPRSTASTSSSSARPTSPAASACRADRRAGGHGADRTGDEGGNRRRQAAGQRAAHRPELAAGLRRRLRHGRDRQRDLLLPPGDRRADRRMAGLSRRRGQVGTTAPKGRIPAERSPKPAVRACSRRSSRRRPSGGGRSCRNCRGRRGRGCPRRSPRRSPAGRAGCAS